MSLLKVLLKGFLALMLVGVLCYATTLHTDAKAPSASPLPNCYVQLVHLHGKKPPTLTCLVKGKLVHGVMKPINFTNTKDCNSGPPGTTYMDFLPT